MIKLATVFSGIGAIEHALTRMNIDNEIIFACDNGDVDIFSKNIDINMDVIQDELNSLESIIEQLDLSDNDTYEMQLLSMLNMAKLEYDSVENTLSLSNVIESENVVKEILKTIVKMNNLNKIRLKLFSDSINKLDSACSLTEKKLLLYQIILKLSNDYKRNNSLEDLGKDNINFVSQYNIDWASINSSLKEVYDILEEDKGKRIINNVRNLSQRVGQLYGKINSLHHLKEINKIESFEEKKAYVDNLYRDYEKRNRVKISYMTNYECPKEHFHWDVTFLDGNQYKNQVDLFVGGSPCQSFSSLGKKRGLSDTRGTLFYEYARLVDEIQPKVFIYENVRAVLSNDCGKTWETMKEVFKQLGYNIFFTNNDNPSILDAKDYGIPQTRNRIFVVGFRSDIDLFKEFNFPKPLKLKYKLQDFLIENSPEGTFLPDNSLKFIKNSDNKSYDLEKYFLSERIKKTILSAGPDGMFGEPIIDREIAQPLLSTMHKMHRAGTDNYVTTDGRVRRLTPRECLRLMGFSDDWKIVVSDTAAYQQAGNSIVVDVLINILKEIIKAYPKLIEE